MIDNKLVKKFLVGATVVTGIVASNVVASSPLHHADTSNIAEASEVTGNFKIETIVQGDKVITGQGPAGAEVTIYLNVDGYEYKLANRPIVNEDGLWESGDIGPWLSEAGNSIRAEVNIDGTISDDRMTILANGEEEVARLFADETDTQLTEGIKQVDIDEAKMLVDALPDRESKETLLNRIKIAQNLLDIKEVEMQAEAKEAVDHLFSDETETSVQSGVNEGTIEAAKQLVEALP
ncbi:toxin Cry1Ac domain D-VI-related protein, partial [Listeria newyorkensis]